MPMLLKQKPFRNALGMLLVIISLASVSSPQETANHLNTIAIVRIKNFGQMDNRFYRGGQPNEKDYKDLAALGIKTVIDLRDDPDRSEKSLVESLGMKYINIPMASRRYPTPEVTQIFLQTVSDPKTGKFFVHCAGGRHRTGAMGAVYRFQFYHWTFDQAYKEMKQYDFYTSWGHQAFKDFVQDYYAKRQASNPDGAQSADPVKVQTRH
ncbi:MAG TPA: tyrosine-protein phosphatase [Pyrinomonadaceae bacterium]|nr:tyrosine-protein phosphatase [Pyrinomonadaceae bacterium]